MSIRRSDVFDLLRWARTVGLGYLILTVGLAVALASVWNVVQENESEIARLSALEAAQVRIADERRYDVALGEYRACLADEEQNLVLRALLLDLMDGSQLPTPTQAAFERALSALQPRECSPPPAP